MAGPAPRTPGGPRRTARRGLLAAIAAFALIGGGWTWLAFFPLLPRDLGGVRSLDAESRRIRIALAPDDSIDGWYLAGRSPAVVLLLHGYGRTHERMWRYGHFLRHAGYHLVLVDFRSSRRRARAPTTLGRLELADARAALDWIRREPALAGHAIGVFGESLGGSIALLLAASAPEIRAVVEDSGFVTGARAIEDFFSLWVGLPAWPFAPAARALGRAFTGVDPGAVDVRPAAAALRDRPVLFIHGLEDRRVAPDQTRALWRAAGARHPLWMIPEVGHCQGCGLGRAYADSVVGFFDHHLLRAAAVRPPSPSGPRGR